MYTEEQKDLLLDKLFDGVVCFDIYNNIDIFHKKNFSSYYNPKNEVFWISENIYIIFLDKYFSSNINERTQINILFRDIIKDLFNYNFIVI